MDSSHTEGMEERIFILFLLRLLPTYASSSGKLIIVILYESNNHAPCFIAVNCQLNEAIPV